jgi:hypothetical protein
MSTGLLAVNPPRKSRGLAKPVVKVYGDGLRHVCRSVEMSMYLFIPFIIIN